MPTTYEQIEKIKEEQLKISNAILDVYRLYGWVLDCSRSDIQGAEEMCGYNMTIDDGTCPDAVGATTHIYAPGGKVFEGSIETPEEASTVMKVLGFEKT